MKKILSITIISILAQFSFGQDMFKDYVFSADQILEHKKALVLTMDQEIRIREIHNNSIPQFNNAKWDLDAEVVRLAEMISKSSVDVAYSVAQLEKILKMENGIKILQMRTLLEMKNVLNQDQQRMLMNLDETKKGYTFISSVNEDPRVTIKVTGITDKDNNKAEPLFIIDYGRGNKVFVRSPENIKPEDIESIQVLKGSSATSLYGSKAKNGVVIITLRD